MSQIRFYGGRNRECNKRYFKQLKEHYEKKFDSIMAYEFFHSDNKSEIPDSVVVIGKDGTNTAVLTPDLFKNTAALSVYVKAEAKMGETIITFNEADYNAARLGDSMRNRNHVIIKKS